MPVIRSGVRIQGTLSYQDEAILRCLARYNYLLSRQVCRLLYSPNSLTYVQGRLKRLADAGYCHRLWLPKRERYGSGPGVYTLARRGITHLLAAGVPVRRRYHPSEQEKRSLLFLRHTLELNDFLICAEILGRWKPEFKLARLLHESQLKRHPVYVDSDSGKRVAVIPDAWLELHIQQSFKVCLVIELDRGTEEQKRWRQKVSNLLTYANGPYQEAFGTTSVSFAVLTTSGPWRLAELIQWTASELESRREQSLADLFLFSCADPSSMDPERIFLEPCWFQPYKKEPLALLEAPWTT